MLADASHPPRQVCALAPGRMQGEGGRAEQAILLGWGRRTLAVFGPLTGGAGLPLAGAG